MKKSFIKDLTFFIVFILIVGFSFIYLYQSSLAKYRKRILVNSNAQIAKWDIILNDENITNKSTLISPITPIFTGTDTVADSKIAPGSIGYFDLIIKASDVDVDFKYEITLNNDTIEENNVLDLRTTGYTLNPTETNTIITPYSNTNNTITGDITHNTEITTIRIYFEWYDGEDNIMDNTQDTDVAIDQNSQAIIDLAIKFEQKKSQP